MGFVYKVVYFSLIEHYFTLPSFVLFTIHIELSEVGL